MASLMVVAAAESVFAEPLEEDATVAYERGDYATALRLLHPLAEQAAQMRRTN